MVGFVLVDKIALCEGEDQIEGGEGDEHDDGNEEDDS